MTFMELAIRHRNWAISLSTRECVSIAYLDDKGDAHSLPPEQQREVVVDVLEALNILDQRRIYVVSEVKKDGWDEFCRQLEEIDKWEAGPGVKL